MVLALLFKTRTLSCTLAGSAWKEGMFKVTQHGRGMRRFPVWSDVTALPCSIMIRRAVKVQIRNQQRTCSWSALPSHSCRITSEFRGKIVDNLGG